MNNKAIILLSGGVDSATVLAIARANNHICYCLSFDYGQKHRVELLAAKRVAKAQGAIEHRVIDIDNQVLLGSALIDPTLAVPREATQGIAATYVPARNTIFLAYALGWAESLGADSIYIGANAQDRAGYPDCRPEYLRAFERMTFFGNRGVRICAPLIGLDKPSIIRKGLALGVDYALTHSCYDPIGDAPCTQCDACRLREQGFADVRG